MLLFRIKCDLKKDTSAAALSKGIDEMHAFCTKFDGFLQQDLKNIFN